MSAAFDSYGELIRWLGCTLYGDPREAWGRYDREQQQLLCGEAQTWGLEPYGYRLLKGMLPASCAASFEQAYRQRSAAAWWHRQTLERLFALLESQAIRSCPLKGIDLMFEVYPDPALRPTGDWDLLIHPDDCARAGEVLRAAGWVQPYATGHDHHFPAFRKDGVTLEVHFRLPNFGELPMTEVWAETVPAGYGGFRRRLTPELNLLMLFRHAAGNHWRQVLPHKLLPDAGWLLKRQGVDWARLRQLCARWRFPSPEVLVKAWPEFFPEELRAHCRATPEQCRDLRWIQDHQPKLIELTATEFAWAQPDRLSGHWLRARLAALAPENLRHKYQLKRIRFRDYPGLYWRELLGKFRCWCRTVGDGPERELVREHFRRCRRLEESGSR